MRLLQVDSGREWRGGQNQVRLLCRELARAPDLEVRLVTSRGGELARRTDADGIAVYETAWALGFDPRAWRTVVHAISDFRPHIIHAHDSHALRLAAWSLPWARHRDDAERLRPRLVGTRRVDFHVSRFSAWRRAVRVIAISDVVRSILVGDGVPATKITVVPSGIDADEVRRASRTPIDVRRRLGLPVGTPLAVNIAALVDHKDQRTLIRAAAAARALRADLHWVIAGEGKMRRQLEQEIAAHGVGDRVHLLGSVPPPEADALIAEADVLVMSSKEEGLGSVILNALALEKPVVATAGGGIPEILPTSALVPVGAHEALARTVVEVVTHPPSPIPLPPRFTSRAMAAGVLAVYRSLV